MDDFDVQVRGAGIVGCCLALALASEGLRVALRPASGGGVDTHRDDPRAFALNLASRELLRRLRVWNALPPEAVTPIHDMHVEGDRDGAAIDFSAWRQAVPALAWIVDAAMLERKLGEAIGYAPRVRTVEAEVEAPLTALCEGRDSAERERLGVGFDRFDYGHRAVAARIVADRPHFGTARQWFASPDVLALLPFDTPKPGRSYALVWSTPEVRARDLCERDASAFEVELAQATGGTAGALRLASARASWALARGLADRWCGPGWALVGDAAHIVHPLAGQGLNLGLADVAALVRTLAAREPWRPLGDPRLLRRYARERAAPTWAMLQATDGLWRLFADAAPAVAELRNRGLTLVDQTTPLKRWLTAHALGT